MENPVNVEMLKRTLSSGSKSEFWLARAAAREIGIDTWDYEFDRHRKTDDAQWYFLMQTDDPARIDRVLEYAGTVLPLDDLASGPALDRGLGSEYASHSALGFIVQDLKRFPGKGWPVVCVALRSRVVSNRNMAINALDAWGRANWPTDATSVLEQALAEEPDREVKARLQHLLQGKPLD